MKALEGDYERLFRERSDAAEMYRRFHAAERDEVIRLQKENDRLSEELAFLRVELGEERWTELADRYDALMGAAVRAVCGLNYTERCRDA